MRKQLQNPRSVIEKWLHSDNTFKPSVVRDLLNLDRFLYERMLVDPTEVLTIKHMETLGALLDKDIIEVFFGAYRKPYIEIAHDPNKVKINNALDKLGIK